MKRFFKLIKFYLGFLVYAAITQDERMNYIMAKQSGCDCIESKDDSRIIYGSARKFTYDTSKPPTRHYITYKRYKELHFPHKKIKTIKDPDAGKCICQLNAEGKRISGWCSKHHQDWL